MAPKTRGAAGTKATSGSKQAVGSRSRQAGQPSQPSQQTRSRQCKAANQQHPSRDVEDDDMDAGCSMDGEGCQQPTQDQDLNVDGSSSEGSSHEASCSESDDSSSDEADKENATKAKQRGRQGGRAGAEAGTKTGARAKGSAKVASQLSAKRNYAEMLAGNVDDATLRSVYQSLAGQRLAERQELRQQLQLRAPVWHLMLRSGFSVLLHGLGSKRDVMQQVAEEQLTDGAVVTCNGFVKSLTAYKVLAAAAGALLGRSCRNVSSGELLSLMHAEAADWPDRRVYVVLHSIDGPGLRSEADQALLAGLAACPNCHLLASTDHVNAALMWSTAIANQFRWVWVAAHTYAPLVAETLDKPSILLGCSQRGRQRGASAVLRSMVGSAREVFALLVTAQLEDPQLEGLDFKQLFRMCRERFLLTNESALRAALTEFTDHELLATRQASDGGGELLYVPLEAVALQKVAQELEEIRTEAA